MVSVGLIGLGKWGLNHLKSLRSIDCDLVGVSDVDVAKRRVADEYGVTFFGDYRELLKRVDAVVVVTPTDTHYNVVKDCLLADKHVFVEKPLAENSERARKLVELAEKNHLILSVGYLYRFNNSIRRLKEVLSDAGEIQYISARYIHSTKPPRKDSGVIMNLGIHVIDILNFITGRAPERVYAKKKNLLSEVFEDSASLVLDYKDFFATIELSCTHPEKRRDMWIIAEKEKVYVDYFNQTIVRHPIEVSYEIVKKGEPVTENILQNEPLKDELRYFVNLVDKGIIDPEKNLGRENYYTTRVCELCLESAKFGREMVVE
ncbi:MAG TPA: Gfo/Idh/MocA family oxidoreductase [Thermoplasmatales archaeon]|nr:Gfo/Idh/MocA family oxidoreductase [Thermoplasmatales archaeon]